MIEIPLYKNGAQVGVAVLDDVDAHLAGFRWSINNFGYACRTAGKSSVYMHRVVMDAPRGLEVDHINHRPLDNRRANLRLVTHAQNHQNHLSRGGTSKYRNVEKHGNKWAVRIRINGVRHYVGRFDTEENADAAARAYRLTHAPFSVEEVAA